jgi:LCP family protein required for cell wall assembly
MPRPKRSASRRSRRSSYSGLARVRRGGRRGGQRRWPRRLLIGSTSLVVILILIAAGVFFYARYRFDQIHKDKVAGLTPNASGKPFDILLVGSDSRAFVDNSSQASAFGSASSTTGQRSDVIIVARIDPTTRQIRLMSIPRDTWVDIPGNVANISGPDRINAAFNNGPSLLVQTIKNTFHIPITYYAEVNFPGFSGMVNALGGIGLDFRYPVKDAYSGLNITTTGCQLVNGTQALALVRSRHLYYYENGAWNYDGLSDFSRIQRQDAFFRAVISKMKGAVTNPLELNNFLGASTKYVTIDQTLSEGELVSLARIFRSFTSAELTTQTLPTSPVTISGQDVLEPAPGPDETMISSFLNFGSTASTTSAVHSSAGSSASTTSEASAAEGSGLLAVLTAAVLDASTTVTTTPGAPAVSPGSVVYNTQSEPWNPVPCTP